MGLSLVAGRGYIGEPEIDLFQDVLHWGKVLSWIFYAIQIFKNLSVSGVPIGR